jgi:hypothetical protein
VPQPPQRVDARSDVAAVVTGVQMFNEAIISTSQVPDTALGHVDPTVKSGKLAKALIEQSQRGTSNFLDNLVRSMRHEARVVNDLLYPIYGRPGRLARMMNPQGEMSTVLLHTPFVMQGDGPQARPVKATPGQAGAKTYTLTKDAEWSVAVKVSKNYDTRREAQEAQLIELVSADPSQMAVIGDLLFKYADTPGHEELAERYKVMLAPPVQALLKGSDQIPPQVQAQLAALQQQVQELSQVADKNVADLKKAELQTQAELERARLEIESRERIAAQQSEVKLTDIEARINLAVAQAMIEYQTTQLEQEQQRRSLYASQAHEREMAALQQAFGQQNAEREQQYALEQGEQGQGFALEQGQQQQANALEQGLVGHQQAMEQQASAQADGAGL